MKYPIAIALAICLSPLAWADEVKLKNGGVLKGLAREECGRVVVETELGTVTLLANEVSSLVQDSASQQEYQERLASIGKDPQAPAIFALALWAKEHQLSPYVNNLLYWTLALDPDHAQARKLLNYVRYEGRWIPAQEREELLKTRTQAQQSAGYSQRRPVTAAKRSRPAPEISPGYVYFGIPPSIPPRGSENHGGGSYGSDSMFSYPYPVGRTSYGIR